MRVPTLRKDFVEFTRRRAVSVNRRSMHSTPIRSSSCLQYGATFRIERPRRRAGQRFAARLTQRFYRPDRFAGHLSAVVGITVGAPPDPRRGSRPPILVAVGSLDGDGPRSSPPGPPARVRRSGSAASASSVAGRRLLRCSISSTSRSSPFLRPRPGLPGREALRWVDHAALVICELGSQGMLDSFSGRILTTFELARVTTFRLPRRASARRCCARRAARFIQSGGAPTPRVTSSGSAARR